MKSQTIKYNYTDFKYKHKKLGVLAEYAGGSVQYCLINNRMIWYNDGAVLVAYASGNRLPHNNTTNR